MFLHLVFVGIVEGEAEACGAPPGALRASPRRAGGLGFSESASSRAGGASLIQWERFNGNEGGEGGQQGGAR